ncbi:MAG: UPF0179 family protein [Archaeoglobaceae archaeon]|nr:UPF0179 family protein [Archaeoglobaceae archaeon]MDW8013637.1 UPF0179 family protein [Archaeoglobaceae archaeon]
MEEANKIITLCSKNWAKIGVEFIFLGGKNECEDCRLKKTCLRLKNGAKYKIVGLREGETFECPLHDEGVVAVEVVEMPVIALIDSKLVEGVKFQYQERVCDEECDMQNLCKPAELKGGENLVVQKIIGNSPGKCTKNYNLVLAELRRLD